MDMPKNKQGKSYFHEKDERYPVSNQSLAEIFEEAANREDQNYVTWHRPAERYTYRELYQRAQDVAKGLIAVGLKRGDCVMGIGCQGSEGAVMLMAATSIGLIFTVPYMFAPAHQTMTNAIENANAKLILVGDVLAGALHERTFMTLNDVLKEYSDAGRSQPLVYHDAISAESEDCMKYNRFAHPLNSLIERGSSIPDSALTEEKSKSGIKAPCFYAHSSGSTGKPKLAVFGANNLTNSFVRRNERLGMTKDNCVVGIQNLTTDDVLFTLDFTAAAQVGYPVVIFPKPVNYFDDLEIPEICECIQQNKITFIHLDQGNTRHITQTLSLRDEYDLTSVKGWMLTAAPISESCKREIIGHYPETSDSYGMTELSMVTYPIAGLNHEKIHSMGRPLPNVEVKICDEDGKIVDCGEQGQILVKTPAMFLCYKDLPELTRSMFTEDGFFKTGDCGWMDDDGDMFFVSRMSRTERYKVFFDVVYAAPIEHVLSRHPKIKESCVVGIHSSMNAEGDDICYCIVPKEANSITLKDIKAYAIENMSNERDWPRRIIFMDKLPRKGARQKVAKLQLIENLEKQVEADNSLYDVEYDFVKREFTQKQL